MLRCQAQLELTLMMCFSDRSTSTGALSDRSTFTSINMRATDLHHCFFWRTCCRLGVCVFTRAQALSPPYLFMVLEPSIGKGLSNKHKQQKEAVRQQEVIISSPFVFTTTPVSELFGRHRQTTLDRGAVFAKTKL